MNTLNGSGERLGADVLLANFELRMNALELLAQSVLIGPDNTESQRTVGWAVINLAEDFELMKTSIDLDLEQQVVR